MNILIACPTFRLEPETIDAIFRQQWDGPVNLLFTRDNPHSTDDYGKANILHNYRKIRRAVLDGGYEAVLIVESDIIPPPDALTRLAALDADLAYGLYLFRRGDPYPVNVLRYVKASVPDQPLTNYPEEYRRVWGKVTRCSGAGLGCVLIHRQVLEQIDFTDDDAHCDTSFTCESFRAGFRMAADMAVVCGHKRPDGRICWPDASGRPRWTQGAVTGFRGITAIDPTERLETDIRRHRGLSLVPGKTLRIRMKTTYNGPGGMFLDGEVYDWPLEAALRAIDGGNAEQVEVEEAPAPAPAAEERRPAPAKKGK